MFQSLQKKKIDKKDGHLKTQKSSQKANIPVQTRSFSSLIGNSVPLSETPENAPLQFQAFHYTTGKPTSLIMGGSTVQKMDAESEQEQPIKTSTPNNTGIPTRMKTEFEEKSGFSFDDVRVHYNSDKPAQLQALAYTQGNQVHVGPGQEEHLRHELGHVVQQKQGIVRPTTRINDVPVNDEDRLEIAAEYTKVFNTTHNPQAKLNGIAQLAGNYDGILPQHDTYDKDPDISQFTYHHIIPENKLLEYINALENIDISSLDSIAKSTWIDTHVKNILHYFNEEITNTYNFNFPLTPLKLKQILNAYPNLDQLFYTVINSEYLRAQNVLKKYHYMDKSRSVTEISELYDYLSKSIGDILQELIGKTDFVCKYKNLSTRKKNKDYSTYKINKLADFISGLSHEYKSCHEIAHSPQTDCFKNIKNLLRRYALPKNYEYPVDEWEASSKKTIKKEKIYAVLAWIPGNIHRGPSKRITPSDKDYNVEIDDGGEKFEESAKKILEPEHYDKLCTLNKLINEKNSDKQEEAYEIIAYLYNKGVTNFKKENWSQHGDYWRFKA